MTNPNDSAYTYDLRKYIGLTKREYFAAIALQGLLSEGTYSGFNIDRYSIEAVRHADALIKQLNKPQDGKETK